MLLLVEGFVSCEAHSDGNFLSHYELRASVSSFTSCCVLNNCCCLAFILYGACEGLSVAKLILMVIS